MIALVVGHGHMGRFHAKVLGDLGYDVVTVDRRAPADYRSTRLALAQVSPDVAAIACPPQHLEAEASKLIGTPMLVEKPFALDRAGAVRLAGRLDGTPCCVGFVERFNPQVRALRQRLEDRTVIARFIRQSERPTSDPLLDLAIHDVDLAAYLGVLSASYEVSYSGTQRTIMLGDIDGVETVNLRDHVLSPLHALWHAFLTGADYPTPLDAIKALTVIEELRDQQRAEAAA